MSESAAKVMPLMVVVVVEEVEQSRKRLRGSIRSEKGPRADEAQGKLIFKPI